MKESLLTWSVKNQKKGNDIRMMYPFILLSEFDKKSIF